MNIIGTGLSGLVGSRIVELLSPHYTFENLSLETGVDITDAQAVRTRITNSDAPWVFHFAAYTNVQGAEKDRALGEKSAAWLVNVQATEHIASICKETGKHCMYIDTDYAFDGTKKLYTEEDEPHPLGWYARTKSEGAKRVLALDDLGLVIRISNPYRANPVGKTDFVHKILERLQTGQPVVAANDQLFVPTFIDDIAAAISVLISHKATGIYHVVASTAISPFEAANTIARTFGYDSGLVKATTFAEYFANRAPTPQYASLSNAKMTALGVSMHDFESGLLAVRLQEAH